jgi:hypothetical protein
MKITIKRIEINLPNIVSPLFPCKNEWWAQVIIKPADNNNTLFNKGKLQQSIALIPTGGQFANSMEGFIDEWKKAQKKEPNNNTSVYKNIINPNFNPSLTGIVWYPAKPSLTTSFNHK